MDESLLTKLAVACQRGDQRSFRVLVEALTRPLIAMAYRYTGDWEWARDLTQETWVRVWERIESYDAERPFSHWLHAVHRNGCLDHVRRQWVRRETATASGVIERLAGSSTDHPLAELERLEFQQRLRVAAEELTASQRAVFVRVDLEGGSQTAVAREMGMQPGNLRTTLHFARRRIARVLKAKEKGHGEP